MSVSKRIASDLWRLKTIPLPPDISAEIVVTGRELKKCGWTEKEISFLGDLIETEKRKPCSRSLSLH